MDVSANACMHVCMYACVTCMHICAYVCVLYWSIVLVYCIGLDNLCLRKKEVDWLIGF